MMIRSMGLVVETTSIEWNGAKRAVAPSTLQPMPIACDEAIDLPAQHRQRWNTPDACHNPGLRHLPADTTQCIGANENRVVGRNKSQSRRAGPFTQSRMIFQEFWVLRRAVGQPLSPIDAPQQSNAAQTERTGSIVDDDARWVLGYCTLPLVW
jgi:hypothetical protein